MHLPLKRSFALLATTAYIAAVVILIQAIAAQARIGSHFDVRQAVASSPLNLDDPCNRSTVVEIKFCGTAIGFAKTRHGLEQTRSTRASSRSASFDTRAAKAGGRDPLVLQMLVEGAAQ
jgi:hypothetical protein